MIKEIKIKKYNIYIVICMMIFIQQNLYAQLSYFTTLPLGEIGIESGVAHYFGDLNPLYQFNKPGLSIGGYYQHTFKHYFGIRANINYARVGYSDAYSNQTQERVRDLSFNTDIWEVSINSTFNFMKFIPGEKHYRFTPYLGIGVGAFYFNPFAYYDGSIVYLQPLGTEGQNLPGGKRYSLVAVSIPVTVGLKYNITRKINIFAEASYRFTTTGYLDDVNGKYAGANDFQPGTLAYYFQDRSYTYGTPIGIAGRQRGNGKNDAFMTIQAGISINLLDYTCPPKP